MIHALYKGHDEGDRAAENSGRLLPHPRRPRGGAGLAAIPRRVCIGDERHGHGSEEEPGKDEKKRAPRSTAGLVALDGFLGTEGKREEFEAVAIKEVLAWQIAEAMREGKLSRKRLAERMNTSRSQIGRLLDPRDGNVTLATLQRAAAVVGRRLRLELV